MYKGSIEWVNGGVVEWMIDCSLFVLAENYMSFIRIMWSINRAAVSRSKYYTEKELASHSLQNGEKIETLRNIQQDPLKAQQINPSGAILNGNRFLLFSFFY